MQNIVVKLKDGTTQTLEGEILSVAEVQETVMGVTLEADDTLPKGVFGELRDKSGKVVGRILS